MAKRTTIPSVWEVPQEFRDRLGTKAGRQRAMFSEGHLLLILHQAPQPEDEERKGHFFWREPDGKWNSDSFGGGPRAVGQHLDEYQELLVSYEERDDSAQSADDYFDVLYRLAPLRRAARHLQQAMQDARELIPDDREIINMRDRAYHIERMSELLYADVRNSLDYIVAKRTEEQAETSHQMSVSAHRLNLLAAFFFPIATLSAIFGVNVLHGWENEKPPLPFLTLLAIGLIMGFLLKSFVTRDAPSKR